VIRQPSTPPPDPLFLDGPRGRLFAIHHAAADDAPALGGVLFLHPFAEEMNRSRRMAALAARALSALGFGVLLLDLYGTGDSEGEFSDARIDIWRGDVDAAAAWLHEAANGPLALVGARFGALLAMDALARNPDRFERAVLWQPVGSGETMITQLLRVRVAAGMANRGARQETTRELRARLAGGETVEVAGYTLSPELVAAVDAMRLRPLGTGCGARLHWIEATGEEAGLLPASRRIIDGWREAGVNVSSQTVIGEPFWSLQETTLAPAMIEATLGALAESRA
jgi:exosortase A-associated hydrolase 2